MRIRLFIATLTCAGALALPATSGAATETVGWAGEQRPAACAPWNCTVKVWTVADYRTFTGTVELAHPIGGPEGCPTCLSAVIQPISAWRWSDGGWQHAPIPPASGHRRAHLAHAAPLAQGWSWVWTAELGWRAVDARSLIVARTFTMR